jgi:hypothetical protein
MVLFFGVNLLTASIFLGCQKVLRIITGSKNKDSCNDLFRNLNILTLQPQYIFLLLRFVIMNRHKHKLTLISMAEM